jgi:hypothetical protein
LEEIESRGHRISVMIAIITIIGSHNNFLHVNLLLSEDKSLDKK